MINSKKTEVTFGKRAVHFESSVNEFAVSQNDIIVHQSVNEYSVARMIKNIL